MRNVRAIALAAMVCSLSPFALAQVQAPANVRFIGLSSMELFPVDGPGVNADGPAYRMAHVGHAAADVRPASARVGTAVASVPVPMQTQSVSASTGSGVRSFAGLDHFTQRYVGGGAYANTQFSLEPPDQALCVGNGYVVEGVNNAFAVYDQFGARLAVTPNSALFRLAPEIVRGSTPVFGPFISDPKCYFDPQSRRWFVTELEIDTDPATGHWLGHSSVMLLVSATSDPTGAYYLYSIDTTSGDGSDPLHPGCPCFGDQPLLGVDANGVYISTNEFPLFVAGFNGAQVYAVSKQALLGGGTPNVVAINVGMTVPTPPVDAAFGSLWYSVQPATSPEGGDGVEYFMSALQFGYTPYDNRLAVWALANTKSLNSPVPALRLVNTVVNTQSYGQATDFGVQQKVGPTPLRQYVNRLYGTTDTVIRLNANDDRMNQVVRQNGTLWAGVNTNVGVGGRLHLGIAWFAVKAQLEDDGLRAQVDQQGYLAVPGQSVIYPSIGVNLDGGAVMGFTLVGPGFFPTAAYARIQDGRAGSVHGTGGGVGADDGFTGLTALGGNGIGRWGDYSAAVADETGAIWLAAESINQACTLDQFLADTTCGFTRSLYANWGTYITRVPAGD